MKIKKLLMMAAGGSSDYMSKVLSLKPLAFWPLNEKSGSVARDMSGNGYNGAYTGVDLGQPGQGGQTCPFFDGTNDYVDIYSAGLNTGWNKSEWSVSLWVKPYNAGVWTDGTARRPSQLNTEVATNGFVIIRTTTNGQMLLRGWMNSTSYTTTLSSQAWTSWTHIVATMSKASDEYKTYLSGTQTGVTLNSIVAPSANDLLTTECVIGSRTTTPTEPWYGWIQYVSIYSRALSAAEVARLAVMG